MFKHQLLMALDEARVYSRQCFLKSLPIMPFYLQTCVDTYATGGLGKNGDPVLRKILYMPALSAWGHNPVIYAPWVSARSANGSRPMAKTARPLLALPLVP
jgi:hypothetical protein